MIVLAFTACMIDTEPQRCLDYKMKFLENIKWVTPYQCAHYGQPELAKWVVNHPRYKITRFKCTTKEKEEHEI